MATTALKLMNGYLMIKGKQVKAYLAANSMADAIRMLTDQYGDRGFSKELRVYWSKNAWGIAMVGISPERGLWVIDNNGKPARAI